MRSRRLVWRFTILELSLISAFAALVGWQAATLRSADDWVPSEARPLQHRYGLTRYSSFAEEWIVRDFFNDRKGGFFVDVGANHYRRYSNTYYLEKHLGWTGVAIEPQRAFEADYRKYRPKTRFLPFFVSDVSNEVARMYVLQDDSLVTSSDRSFTERYGSNPQEVEAATITLDDLLTKEAVHAIDFLSIDIELSEPKALSGFDIARFRPELVCIEAHPEVRQQILDYFARHHYVVAGKYLRADRRNLYFTPQP